jgi:hypothetical protein
MTEVTSHATLFIVAVDANGGSMGDANDRTRGKVYPQYYVTCGKCGEENPLGTIYKSLIPRYLLSGGYVKTKEYGFVCEQCSKK